MGGGGRNAVKNSFGGNSATMSVSLKND